MNAPAAKTLQTPEDFRDAGLIAPEFVPILNVVTARYVAAVPPTLHTAITETGADGPIARQFVPSPLELTIAPDERDDPIGDVVHSPIKGIVHRYPDRALLMPTHVCAVYCRFCFRREAVGPDGGLLSAAELDGAMSYIARTPTIWEVILTGGDPLVLSSRRLEEIVRRLDVIPHVRVLRVHTRVPVATPERIDSAMIDALRASAKAVYVAIHCNHPAELSREAVAACARLADGGLSLLSQSVLLKGVNDSVETLEQLMRALVAARVKPYYLHHLDLAPGTSHFRVPIAEGQALMRALRTRVSGLALPTYVLDIPGGFGKVPIGPTYLEPASIGAVTHSYAVEDRIGARHVYPPGPE